jgi:hypothetical protein
MKTKKEDSIWNWVIKDKIIEKGLSNPNEEYDIFTARLFTK